MESDSNGSHAGDPSWEGTPEELRDWIEYKRRKVIEFVGRGYSVEWIPDGANWFGVYRPEQHDAGVPELRADIKAFPRPSTNGIDWGKVSKLTITLRRTELVKKVMSQESEETSILFSYDRGSDIDNLQNHPEAQRLYRAVIEAIN